MHARYLRLSETFSSYSISEWNAKIISHMICKVCAYLTHLSTLDCVGYMLCNAIVCKAYIDVLFGSAIIFCFHYCLCVNAIWRCWAILFTISVVYQCIKLFFTQLACTSGYCAVGIHISANVVRISSKSA